MTIKLELRGETKEFRRGIKVLKQAYIYAHRMAYLISCDDGENEHQGLIQNLHYYKEYLEDRNKEKEE